METFEAALKGDGHRLTRRRLLGAGAATWAGTGAVLISGCRRGAPRSGATPATATNQAALSRRGGTLNHPGGTAGSFDTLGLPFDPHIQGLTATQTFTLVYERLLAYDPRSYTVRPEIAQKWEQVSPTEYRFSLQPGVRWHDKPPANGRPLTTDDVLFGFQRAQTNDPKFVNRSLLEFVDKMQPPDSSTITLTTKVPNASALRTLSNDGLAFVAKDVFDKWRTPSTPEQVIGTGAFVVTALEEDVGAEYSRNPNYWKAGQPYLDTLRTRQFNDLLTAWSAFQAGPVDTALLPGTEVPAFVARQGPGFAPSWFADYSVNISLPNIKAKPLDDARVVRAVRLLIDHDEFISAWANPQYGHGGYGSIFPAALADWDLQPDEYRSHLEWKQPKDDAVKEALALLSAAGYGKDKPVQFALNAVNKDHDQAAAELLQAQWNRLGQGSVEAQLKLTDTPTGTAIRAARSFAWGNYGIAPSMPDPDVWLTSCYRTGASQNYSRFSDPQADAIIDKQRGLFDEAERKAAVRDIITYMIDHGPNTIPATRTSRSG